MNFGWEITKIIFYLLLIVGIIYLLSYPLKRKVLEHRSSKYMKIIDRLYYDSKHSFILMEIEEEIILIAQSERDMEKISSWKKSELDIDFSSQQITADDKQFSFKDYFRKFAGKNKGDRGE